MPHSSQAVVRVFFMSNRQSMNFPFLPPYILNRPWSPLGPLTISQRQRLNTSRSQALTRRHGP